MNVALRQRPYPTVPAPLQLNRSNNYHIMVEQDQVPNINVDQNDDCYCISPTRTGDITAIYATGLLARFQQWRVNNSLEYRCISGI